MKDDASELRDLSEAEIEAVSGGIVIGSRLSDLSAVMLNPQPLPPRWWLQLNPQPEPPGVAAIGPQPQPA
jgi:hypothetical protein